MTAQIIQIRRRATGGSAGAPASLKSGEPAWNNNDNILYFGFGDDGAGNATSVVKIGGTGAFADLASAQTVAGVKTFSSSPVLPTPASTDNSTNAATTAFVKGQSLDMLAVPAANLNINAKRLTSVADPTSPQDAATKNYVDASVQGLTPKPTATWATTAALPAATYGNGASGVGSTLTASANGAVSVDGSTPAVGDIVLVKNQAAGAQNGLYIVTQVGDATHPFILTRHVDMDTAAEFAGAFVPVGAGGATNANTLWLANPSGTVTVGSTAIPFTQLNSATSYVNGTGITITGNQIAVATGSLSAAAGLTPTANTVILYSGASAAALLTVSALAQTLLGNTTAAAMQSTLGLGSIATQAASSVAITGGSISGATFSGTLSGVTVDGGTF